MAKRAPARRVPRHRSSLLAAFGCVALVLLAIHALLARRVVEAASAAPIPPPDAPSEPATAGLGSDGHSPPGTDLDARYPASDHWRNGGRGGGGRADDAPWLVEMRRQWLGNDVKPVRAASSIPERIHQTWKDASPPRKLFSPRWRASLKSLNPTWDYKLWTDADNRALVAQRYPAFLATYDAYPSPIQRADVSRYLVASTHGGIYADLDTECYRPFRALLRGRAAAARGASLVLSYKLGANFSRGAVNSIFGTTAGHPFWAVVLDVLANRSTTALSGHKAVLYSTGPAVLREAIRRLLRLPAEATVTAPMMAQLRRVLGIVVLDARLLHPVTAERRAEARKAAPPADAFCAHHFVTSWVEHDADMHRSIEERRRSGEAQAAMSGGAQSVRRGAL